MAQFNFLNVAETAGRGRKDRQAHEFNQLRLDAAQQGMQRDQTEYDEAQRLANTKFAAGATKYALELFSKDPQQGFGVLDALDQEGARRGVTAPGTFSSLTEGSPEEAVRVLQEKYNIAMSALGGQESDGLRDTKIPSDVRTARWYASATPEEREHYDRAKRTQPGVDVIEVNMPDGSTMQMLYDPQWGTVYDLDGNMMNKAPPSAPGRSGQRPPYAAGPSPAPSVAPAPQADAPVPGRPPGLGTGQTPYQTARDKAQAAADVEKLQRTAKETDQANTAIATGYSLMPVMQRAINATSPWTAGKGSIIADMPFFGRGSEAGDLEADLTTIKANIGFDRLQRMRAESPTGGALGQVAVQELVALQSTLRNLSQSQSHDRLAENLQDVMAQYKRWIDAWGEAVAKEGDDDQYRRYYDTVPAGAEYFHRNGTKIRKRGQ